MASIERREVQRSVRCILTDREKLSYGDQMGKSTQLHAQAVDQRKEVGKQLAADVDKYANEVSRLGTLIANGYEYRVVDCILRIDRISGRATVTDPNTGEVLEERALTTDEKQAKLDFDAGASAALLAEGRSLVEELQDKMDKEPGSGADIEVVSVELTSVDTGEEGATDAEAKPEDQQ